MPQVSIVLFSPLAFQCGTIVVSAHVQLKSTALLYTVWSLICTHISSLSDVSISQISFLLPVLSYRPRVKLYRYDLLCQRWQATGREKLCIYCMTAAMAIVNNNVCSIITLLVFNITWGVDMLEFISITSSFMFFASRFSLHVFIT